MNTPRGRGGNGIEIRQRRGREIAEQTLRVNRAIQAIVDYLEPVRGLHRHTDPRHYTPFHPGDDDHSLLHFTLPGSSPHGASCMRYKRHIKHGQVPVMGRTIGRDQRHSDSRGPGA
jgi:hypothetical protein